MKIALFALATAVLVFAAPGAAGGPTTRDIDFFQAGHLPGSTTMCGVDANYRTHREVGTETRLFDANGGVHLRVDLTITETYVNDTGGPGTVFTAWTTTARLRQITNFKFGGVETTTVHYRGSTTIGPTGQVVTTNVVGHLTLDGDGVAHAVVENEKTDEC